MVVIWEDKEIKFDIPFASMKLRSGEKIIDRVDSIEDSKGNGGDKGRLIVTNLRTLWHSVHNPRINLSIGYGCIMSSAFKVTNSKYKGRQTQALHILATYKNMKFEFIFTNLSSCNQQHFASTMGAHKAYVSSCLYRELKMRAAIIINKNLRLLPLEQVYTTMHGVWNLSNDQGNLGTFIITNIRIVWFADINEGFNISLPYLQIEHIKLRESKFGMTLVVTSSEASGAYMLGFKIDSEEKLQNIYEELRSLWAVYSSNPIFGIDYTSTSPNNVAKGTSLVFDVDENCDTSTEISNELSMYLADEQWNKEREPVYYPDFGLAVENVKKGFSVKTLWDIFPNSKSN